MKHILARIRRPLPYALSVLSGLLLFASFPPLEWADFAWFAFIPLLAAIRLKPESAFALGWYAGMAFWLPSIFWLTRVTVMGWLGLSMYCALYAGLFAYLSGVWLARFGVERFLPNLALMAVAALAWAGLEHARGIFATGFPWNPLGVSQFRNAVVIQVASVGGVHAVSALVVWVSFGMALTFLRYVAVRGRWGRRPHAELMCGFLALALSFWFGVTELRRPVAGVPLRVALLQLNIPQDDKWSADTIPLIYQRLRDLTEGALRATQPDLVVWPETALPDDVRRSETSYKLVYDLATNGVPILAGSMDTAWRDDGSPVFYNCSFLFDGSGALVQGYDKRHLVPFGEYIPLRRWLPFMTAMTPIQESFTPGATSTVFRIERPAVSFSALICFEDAVARLARESVRNGARMLVNQTNDAWFDPLWGSRQHVAHCVFRCVENRVPAVRAANTGVTCHIDERGRIRDVLDDGKGGTMFHGFMPVSVSVPEALWEPTPYHRHGDRWAFWSGLTALGAAGMLLARPLVRRGRRLA